MQKEKKPLNDIIDGKIKVVCFAAIVACLLTLGVCIYFTWYY